ncbi:hypothetical protein [Carboxylicivirga sp. M1479]|uniref:hypothetical protein n=1 Tax=Carboxylicivirga sp. M1479 TaxID=2594476 RepID=UPI0011774411|nr:hypothetical protein [Carboxylicivirga sp. M1479]TRX66130.1 hypothetical protein FNN09_15120 [Carboxylicivirga sp. M1479]
MKKKYNKPEISTYNLDKTIAICMNSVWEPGNGKPPWSGGGGKPPHAGGNRPFDDNVFGEQVSAGSFEDNPFGGTSAFGE